ncbi:hypothetical protein GEMRC1_001577 [Eukaryota sp. GEM-RC1]
MHSETLIRLQQCLSVAMNPTNFSAEDQQSTLSWISSFKNSPEALSLSLSYLDQVSTTLSFVNEIIFFFLQQLTTHLCSYTSSSQILSETQWLTLQQSLFRLYPLLSSDFPRYLRTKVVVLLIHFIQIRLNTLSFCPFDFLNQHSGLEPNDEVKQDNFLIFHYNLDEIVIVYNEGRVSEEIQQNMLIKAHIKDSETGTKILHKLCQLLECSSSSIVQLSLKTLAQYFGWLDPVKSLETCLPALENFFKNFKFDKTHIDVIICYLSCFEELLHKRCESETKYFIISTIFSKYNNLILPIFQMFHDQEEVVASLSSLFSEAVLSVYNLIKESPSQLNTKELVDVFSFVVGLCIKIFKFAGSTVNLIVAFNCCLIEQLKTNGNFKNVVLEQWLPQIYSASLTRVLVTEQEFLNFSENFFSQSAETDSFFAFRFSLSSFLTVCFQTFQEQSLYN